MELNRTAKRVSAIRKIGWLSVASMLALALLAPAANAQEGNQTNVSPGDATQLCTGGPNGDIEPVDGMVAWVFIHANVDKDLTGTLTAHFESGDLTADSYVQGGIKYIIWTDDSDVLLSFEDDIDGGVLTLSHVCSGVPETETPSQSVFEETEAPSVPVETETPSQPVETETPSDVPSQSVLEETDSPTGTPSVTLPPTDTLTGTSAPSGDSWRMLVIAMAALLASVLVMTPAKASSRRR